MHKILIVEDDADTRSWIESTLKTANFEVEYADDGARGLALAQSGDYSLLVLDVVLPTVGGIEICQTLRSRNFTFPILMLSTQAQVRHRVDGLLVGADDYLGKPFEPIELVARITALLRRAELFNSIAADELVMGDLRIDLPSRQVTVGTQKIELTAIEFDLLTLFANNPGRVFTREQLAEKVWDYSAQGFGPTITTHLSRLRSKLEANPRKPRYIKTAHGVGYRFATLDELKADGSAA